MTSQPLRRFFVCAVALLALACLVVPSTSAGAQTAGGRLDSHLERLALAAARGDSATVGQRARELGIEAPGGNVRVIVQTESDNADTAAASATRAGAVVEAQHGSLVQVRVAAASLRTLASADGIEFVRIPMKAMPLVTGQGVSVTNADSWQAQGLTGAGVKVAIVDLGFAGYQAKLGTELPSSVTAVSFRQDGDITGGGEPHGTAVAEVVHEMAPAAQLYLVNFNTEMELLDATNFVAAQGITVVNASWGYFASGPGDGTGFVDGVISNSVSGGVFWAVAAGNHAQRHWAGPFQDTDADNYHEFSVSPLDEANQVGGSISAGQTIVAELKWDDPFGAACRDYDLYLMRTQGSSLVTVDSSQNVQHNGSGCVPGADPTESIVYQTPSAGTYHLVIQKQFAPTTANFDLLSWTHDLEHRVTATSLLQPGDNASVTTTGAVYYALPGSIETFSSRGPTNDGRTKPDIVAPDGVSNATYGSFSGTSAASPHVSGAAALVKGRLPCFTPAQIGALLESNVVDLGTPGKDNTFGSGRLSLGAPPPDTDGDGVGDACDADADGDSLLDATEVACGVTGLGAGIRPERLDGSYAGVSDDGDAQIDEPLPPGSGAYDCDGDGYGGATEASIFAPATQRDQDPCGSDGWPSNTLDAGDIANALDIQDIVSFIAPVRRLGTSSGDPNFSPRWDLLPGTGPFTDQINIQDITTVLGGVPGAPPMFGGMRAFGRTCPWPG